MAELVRIGGTTPLMKMLWSGAFCTGCLTVTGKTVDGKFEDIQPYRGADVVHGLTFQSRKNSHW